MKKRKCSLQNKLYLPIKLNGDKKEFMVESHNKIKSYKSTQSLLTYTPDCDLIATFTMSSIIDKNKVNL